MKCKQIARCVSWALALLMTAGAAMAASPHCIDYQGRATDASGTPVTDGDHTVKFEIFDKFNNNFWNETAAVTTASGFFTHRLGSVTPLNVYLFNARDSLFLQVTFDGQLLAPRTMFTASPYAFHVNSVDGSTGGIIIGSVSINSPVADDEVAGIAIPLSGSPNLWMKDVDGNNRIKLDAATRSLEFVHGAVTSTPAKITSEGTMVVLGDGKMKVNSSIAEVNGRLDVKGTAGCWIDPSSTGDGSVYLPDAGINNREIADEPGIACAMGAPYYLAKFPDTEDGEAIDSVFITTPSSGYIVVEAKFNWNVDTHAPSVSHGWIQIDEVIGGGPEYPHFADYALDTASYGRFPGYVSRVFYKPAGTHLFYLEAGVLTSNAAVPGISFWMVLARYYPTSYGSVETVVASEDAGHFEKTAPFEVNGKTMYSVDLRELELRAAKAEADAERARADAEKAKRKLLEAQNEASQN